jgi:hypothetical protein
MFFKHETDTAEMTRPMTRAPHVVARLKLMGDGPGATGAAADITEQYVMEAKCRGWLSDGL